MKAAAAVITASLALAGCATMDAGECRGADWYQLGFRDAIFGIQPQHDIYAALCQQHGLRIDDARYTTGWREGNYEFQSRKSQSGTD